MFNHQLEEDLRKPKQLSSFRKDVAGVKEVDSRNDTWGINLDEYMAQHAFYRLGSGKYASVYGNDRYPYVIKVFMRDSAYQRWLNFSLKNASNTLVPKIRGKVVKISDMIFAVRLEKLRPLKKSFSSYDFMKEYSKWQSNKKYVSPDKNVQAVLDHFGRNKSLIDLHGENAMERPNGDFVISDPYYNWYSPGKGYSIDPYEKIPGLIN